MAEAMGSNFWIANFPGGVGQPSAPAYGGGGTDMMAARNPLDMKRMAAGFAPGASYPDGYLGTLTNRQGDRDIPAVLQSRLTSTSYQRGVHAGEKQPKGAYYWSEDMNPMMGLERQQQAVQVDQEGAVVWSTPRQSVTGDPVEMIANDGKLAGKTSREIEQALRDAGGDPAKNPVTQVSSSRAAQMRATHTLPAWSGVRSGAI
jgi:hypothetical protein